MVETDPHEIFRIGIDTGGTFTDIAWIDGNILKTAKVPSRPDHPALGVLDGLNLVKNKGRLVCHGTTVGTNAVLARQGGPAGIVVTKGFADILKIGRGDRSNLYSKTPSRPTPLIDRDNVFEINVRFDNNGKQISYPSEDEYNELLENIEKSSVKALGIGLLHSATQPTAENLLAQTLANHSGLPVFASAQLAGYPREYERWSLAALSAYLAPVLGDYLGELEEKCPSKLAIMTSSGGLVSTSHVSANPALCVLSGPAGGALGALNYGPENILALDMGGTSTDVTLLPGKIPRTRESEIDGLPVPLPAIDIHTIGAGGGSIISFDRGGMLAVGPGSAGADPGPACYGNNGPPCLSDVALIAGRILPDRFLGGQISLDEAASKIALDKILPQGMLIDELLDSVIELAVVHLTGALRKISVARGIDPAENFVLMPFGGAGALFAVECARSLGLKQVIHPRASGVFSALGLLGAPIAAEKESAVMLEAGRSAESLNKIINELKNEIREILSEWDDAANTAFTVTTECRYSGQTHTLEIPIENTSGIQISKPFETAYQQRYTYTHPGTPVEIVTVRVRGEIPSPAITFEDISMDGRDKVPKSVGSSMLRIEKSWCEGSVYERDRLPVDVEFNGPAVVVEDYSTLFLPPGSIGRLDVKGNVVVEV